eukprot:CAMPEP_0116868444 /NCGR_PEP_ID=MMETSP0418-20121206/27197_1 /TAXON_ID=1158023 /ORGANISM="Astrosyne radiata, Strain 13vi08-1A" /LENGTH=388 /DNA_ID=CAMNT_0004504409 /DNA_START=52 /DNA_END=1218 /DNA_ORIENTATION=+
MKISASVIAAVALVPSARVGPSSKATFTRKVARFSAVNDEVARLREQAAKAKEEAKRIRAEAKKLEEEWGKEKKVSRPEAAKVVEPKKLTLEDANAIISKIDFQGGDAISQVQSLDSYASTGELQMWKMAEKEKLLRPVATTLQTLSRRTYGTVDGEALGITGESEVPMDDFKVATVGVLIGCSVLGVAALAYLPENVGATVCYFLAVIPVLFLGVGSAAPGLIGSAIQGIKGTGESAEQKRERVCRHEAGHFMCGYLCGLPVKKYSLMEEGVPSVEFHPSPEGEAFGRQLSEEEIAALSVVAMSGSVGEILGFGNAKGGEVDMIGLEAFFARSEEFIPARKKQDLARWGALVAFQLLKRNEKKFNELVEAFQNKKSVAECVAILEAR